MSKHTPGFIDIVFDGPPSHESGRFVEVENEAGASVGVGEWIDRGNGLWALRIPYDPSGIGELVGLLKDALCVIRSGPLRPRIEAALARVEGGE